LIQYWYSLHFQRPSAGECLEACFVFFTR